MNTELFDLCKAVYEKTGWKNVFFSREEGTFQVIKYSRSDYKMHVGLMDSDEIIEDFQEAYPLYTSDYLLEKLPRVAVTRVDQADFKDPHYFADSFLLRDRHRQPIVFRGDTPLKALLKLTLALADARVLKTEGHNE